jgi:aldose 1-epimerase
VLTSASEFPLETANLSVRPFSALRDGREVEAWVLAGRGGLRLEVLTYGGIVSRLLLQEGSGQFVDVVLGPSALEEYLDNRPYFGAIVGRVAGRMTGAKFSLDGSDYAVSCNEPPNHLHGGTKGFDKQLWSATPASRADGAPSLRLHYRSRDGEEGYPGNVAVSVTYTVTDDNIFLVETCAEADRATPFSLTNHSYFNLGGEGSGSIADHTLQVYADDFIGTHEDLTLLDRAEPVEGRADDLREPRLLGDVLPLLSGGHGALYPVGKPAHPGALVPVARLTHPPSGRVLMCSTTNTHLQVYTASAFDGSIIGKSGLPYGKYAGICLECEGYANGANAPEMGDIILRPGAAQIHMTAYAFTTMEQRPPTGTDIEGGLAR